MLQFLQSFWSLLGLYQIFFFFAYFIIIVIIHLHYSKAWRLFCLFLVDCDRNVEQFNVGALGCVMMDFLVDSCVTNSTNNNMGLYIRYLSNKLFISFNLSSSPLFFFVDLFHQFKVNNMSV